MLRTFLLLAIFGVLLCQAGPGAKIENLESRHVECAVCQFLGASVAAKTGSKRAESMAHCLKFEGCEREQTDCEIVATLHAEIQKTTEKFGNSREIVANAVKKCASDSKALVISEDTSSAQCMLCFLVYDVLKYINYNILDNPMLGTVTNAIDAACDILPFNNDLCQALIVPDVFSAIIRGLKDSLGGFYDLIAVQGFGCVPYTKLFGACPH